MSEKTPQDIHATLKEHFGDRAGTLVELKSPHIEIEAANLIELCTYLRDEESLDFNMCHCITGVDYGWEKPAKKKKGEEDEAEPAPPADRGLGVVYHLYSTNAGHIVTLKISLPRENPSVPTVDRLWAGANWLEREVYDMHGIIFEGSRDLRRILLPDDWEGFPLRKDYSFPEDYQGYSMI
jgi:NADH-quinone oxidoreductase subunit C